VISLTLTAAKASATAALLAYLLAQLI